MSWEAELDFAVPVDLATAALHETIVPLALLMLGPAFSG